jgi:DNA-binding NarL/FixJ family response regulator
MPQLIKIVIADDSPLFLDGLRLMLSGQQVMRVAGVAGDGTELLTAVKASSPDVVITDIQMPVMSGIEATRKIKEQFPSIAVIALTMFGEDALIMEMLDAGASGYLLKNASKEDLVQAIHAVNAGEKYFCATTSKQLAKMISNRLPAKIKSVQPELLTEKEQHIVKLICQEYSTKQIAGLLEHTPKTIEAYRMRLMEKIGAHNTAGIVIYAIKNGLYKP